jgi:sugar diacid utilization regulator
MSQLPFHENQIMNENQKVILQQVAENILSIRDWDELVQSILHGGIRIIGDGGALFCIHDISLNQLISQGSFGFIEREPKEILKLCKRFFDGITGPKHQVKAVGWYAKVLYKSSSVYLFPLKQQSIYYGVLAFYPKGYELSEQQLDLLRFYLQSVSIAVENSRLYLQIQRKAEGLTHMNQLHQLLARSSFQDLMAETVQRVGKLLNSEMAGIMLYDLSRNELVLQKPAFGVWDETIIEQYHVSLKEGGNAVSVFLSGIPSITNHASHDQRYIQRFVRLFDPRNIVTVPISVDGKNIGVLHSMDKRDGPFTHDDIQLLMEISSHLGIILDGALIAEQHQQTSYTNKRKDMERNFSRQLVRNILNGNFNDWEELPHQTNLLNIPSHPPFSVMAVGVHKNGEWMDHLLKEHIEGIEKTIRHLFPIYGLTLDGNIGILLSPQEMDQQELTSRKIQRELSNFFEKLLPSSDFRGLDVLVGIGDHTSHFEQIHASYRQAKLSLHLLPQIPIGNKVGQYSMLGIWSLLLELSTHGDITPVFLDTYLKTINEMKNADELKKTLETYISNSCQIKKTSEEIFLHPNTVKYRMDKIQQKTGFDLTNPEVQLNLNIALRLERIMRNKRK